MIKNRNNIIPINVNESTDAKMQVLNGTMQTQFQFIYS